MFFEFTSRKSRKSLYFLKVFWIPTTKNAKSLYFFKVFGTPARLGPCGGMGPVHHGDTQRPPEWVAQTLNLGNLRNLFTFCMFFDFTSRKSRKSLYFLNVFCAPATKNAKSLYFLSFFFDIWLLVHCFFRRAGECERVLGRRTECPFVFSFSCWISLYFSFSIFLFRFPFPFSSVF